MDAQEGPTTGDRWPMTSDREIARWRLRSQHLVRPHASGATDAVRKLLAVQAENPSQSAWAVAARSADPSRREVRAPLTDGRLVRIHVLRPTWHYVCAEDVGWLLELTGPRVRRTTGQALRGPLGLDDRDLERAGSIVEQAVGEQPDLTRGQIAQALRRRGFDTTGQLVMILLAHLELGGVICSGRPVGDEPTYALMADRVANPRRLDRAEALGELALRYFTGHGPATDRDLSYWATMTLTDVRQGLSRVRDRLACFEHQGRTFWHAADGRPDGSGQPVGHLLQILDEMYRGYHATRWVLDASGDVPRSREPAIGMALVDAQLVAAMRRTIGQGSVDFELTPYRPLTTHELDALDGAAERYGEYLGLAPRLVFR
jgi:hypothetical protein